MIERRIKAILFDGNGVIYYRKGGNTLSLLAQLLAEAGHLVRLEGIKDPSWKKVEHAAFTGRIDKWAYWDSLLLRLGVGDPEERKRFSARLAEAVAQVYLIEGVAETLAKLKERGIKCGMVTDTYHQPSEKMAWLRRLGVARFFDVVVCSTELGVRKPDARMYLTALDRMGNEPAEALFVGHSGKDLEGAREVGLITVAFRPDEGAKGDCTIRRLAELLPLCASQSVRFLSDRQYGNLA